MTLLKSKLLALTIEQAIILRSIDTQQNGQIDRHELHHYYA
jgi:hypothetical protein